MRLENDHEWGANKDSKEVIMAYLKIMSKNAPETWKKPCEESRSEHPVSCPKF
jgi:hypothetical protein